MYPFYRKATEAVQLQIALNYLPGFQACNEDSQGRNFSPGHIITWWRYHSVSSEFWSKFWHKILFVFLEDDSLCSKSNYNSLPCNNFSELFVPTKRFWLVFILTKPWNYMENDVKSYLFVQLFLGKGYRAVIRFSKCNQILTNSLY